MCRPATVTADLAVGQRVDAVAQRQQRAVDVGALPEALASILRDGGALGAGQVDQRHLGDAHVGRDARRAVTLTHEHLSQTSNTISYKMF